MRIGEVLPPPTYPEYEQLLAQAKRNASGPVDANTFPKKQRIMWERGDDWCLAVLGKPCHGLGRISCVDAELLVLADAANINPPLPQWVVDARAETARRKKVREDQRAALRQRDQAAWDAAREQCPVELEVRLNPTSRVRDGEWHNLGHAVPLVDALSRRRLHPKGRALCESLTRARPLRLGEPTSAAPATCVRCLAYVSQIRPAEPPAAPSGGPDPDAQMVAGILLHCGQPITTELLVSAANAYGALRSSREREQRRAGRQSKGEIR